MPTIRLVAKACNVSPMTVSHVLNGKVGEVSEETRERVLKVYAKWAIDRLRVNTRRKNARSVLWESWQVYRGIPSCYRATTPTSSPVSSVQQTMPNRMSLSLPTVCCIPIPTRSLRVYCDGRCDGLVVIAPLIRSPLVKALEERGFPIVIVGDTGDSEMTSYVDVDNRAEACRHRGIPGAKRTSTDRVSGGRRVGTERQ